MKTTLTCLVVCSAIALPFAAMAAMTDAQYCEALSVEYRKLDTQRHRVLKPMPWRSASRRFGRRHSRARKGPEGR